VSRKRKLSMRKIREVARLAAAGLSIRQIAGSCQIARSTVGDYLGRLAVAGMSWPFDPDLSDEEIDGILFVQTEDKLSLSKRAIPEWQHIHKELRRKAVTKQLLWQEYREEYADGYGYSQFCDKYKRWAKNIDVTMRQTHLAGEKLFVDYAGMRVPIRDPLNGTVFDAEIFVATLGASNYIYAEATRSQQSHDWISSHVRAFEHIGGVTQIVVPDNLKSGVTSPCRYEPDINKSYADMAAFYGIAVIPARVRKPKDKAKVETSVQIVEREVLAPLRDYTFFSLAELNAAIMDRLEQVNKRSFQKLDGSRLELFEEIDKPALKPLPALRYEFAEFRTATVNIDYHIDVLGHYYSVPYELKGQKVDVCLRARMVEVLHNCKRIASHMRDDRKGTHTTDSVHMPKAHREHLAWTPSRIISWAGKTGPYCRQVAEKIIASREHPEQGYRACLGIIRLGKDYDRARIEAACRRALALDVCSYKSIKSILKSGKDREALEERSTEMPSCQAHHQNVRGKDYYETQKQGDIADALAKEACLN
jgi:transposase